MTAPPGRTGRKGNTGTSYTLFTPGNAPKARDLVAVLTEAKQVINPKLAELVGRGGGGGGGRYGGGLCSHIFGILCCVFSSSDHLFPHRWPWWRRQGRGWQVVKRLTQAHSPDPPTQ